MREELKDERTLSFGEQCKLKKEGPGTQREEGQEEEQF